MRDTKKYKTRILISKRTVINAIAQSKMDPKDTQQTNRSKKEAQFWSLQEMTGRQTTAEGDYSQKRKGG